MWCLKAVTSITSSLLSAITNQKMANFVVITVTTSNLENLVSCLFNTFVVTDRLHALDSSRYRLSTYLITTQFCMDYFTYRNWVASFTVGHCGHIFLCLCVRCVTLSHSNSCCLVCWSNSWKLYIMENISHNRSHSPVSVTQGCPTGHTVLFQ
jgi:hypothetical protein